MERGSEKWNQDQRSGTRIREVERGSERWNQDQRSGTRIREVEPGSEKWNQDQRGGTRIREVEPGSEKWNQDQMPFRAHGVRGYHEPPVVSYPYQTLGPRPGTAVRRASLLHLHTRYTIVLSSSARSTRSTQQHHRDRGYPPCSSSLLDPELPSSQQLLVLVPLPDRLFPPWFTAAPGPLLPPPAGASASPLPRSLRVSLQHRRHEQQGGGLRL